MSLSFNCILKVHGLDPKDVRLIRHKDRGSSPGSSPYELWRNNTDAFNDYQSSQRISKRKIFPREAIPEQKFLLDFP